MIADFQDLLSEFVKGRVRFMIVGAHALAAHGVPRVTGDLDIWIDNSPDNATRAWNALVSFGAPLESLDISEQDLARPDQVVQFGLPPYRIDVLTSISGVQFDDAWERRHNGTLLEVPVFFLGRDDLIRNKLASGREKDVRDVEALEGR